MGGFLLPARGRIVLFYLFNQSFYRTIPDFVLLDSSGLFIEEPYQSEGGHDQK